MVKPGAFIKASLDASKEFFRTPEGDGAPETMAAPAGDVKAPTASPAGKAPAHPMMVPIRSMGPSHRERIAIHLFALSGHDRYLRFGYAATDDQIRRYVASLNFDRDEIFGIYNRRLELIAVAHLAFSTDPQLKSCAEFGVSVLSRSRGKGYGARLFDRAMMHARNNGVDMMFIHALSENTAMLNIARKAGARIERDGAESQAYLKLPPADLDSRMTEMLEEQMAQTDYRLKVQAKQFWDLLAMVQEVRRGVQDAREKTSA